MTHSDQPHQHSIDARGLLCPEPVMMLHNAVRDAAPGDVIEVLATDPSTQRDITRFCEFLSHELVAVAQQDDEYRFLVRKG
ncbi:sulfurtransferase TusA [Teredinibacter turnerae]|uniref:sulfurtransferase TusA n=1 Tax=Teredinibacter turnerae TaxID=2426 RepID=UPI0003A7A161|nr:sulfurtransferase TusA [Teredinibacter turnerae]